MQISPAASEAIILSLGQSSQPYKTCQFILGWSHTFIMFKYFTQLSYTTMPGSIALVFINFFWSSSSF